MIIVPPVLLADKFAVPSFLVVSAAVKLTMFVALTVASLLTIKISSSPPNDPPKSLSPSVPESILNVSLPSPPVRLSSPAPPVILSLPPPPTKVSSLLAPEIISSPVPPVN